MLSIVITDVFNGVNMYLYHFKFCVLMVKAMFVVSNECDGPTTVLCVQWK